VLAHSCDPGLAASVRHGLKFCLLELAWRVSADSVETLEFVNVHNHPGVCVLATGPEPQVGLLLPLFVPVASRLAHQRPHTLPVRDHREMAHDAACHGDHDRDHGVIDLSADGAPVNAASHHLWHVRSCLAHLLPTKPHLVLPTNPTHCLSTLPLAISTQMMWFKIPATLSL
jgi:hypothetical protein